MNNTEILKELEKFNDLKANFGDWPVGKVKDHYYNLVTVATARNLTF